MAKYAREALVERRRVMPGNFRVAWTLVSLGAGCAPPDEPGAQQRAVGKQLAEDVTADAIGSSITLSPTAIDQSAQNPFFASFGTNGRVCGTCHQERFGWTITPELARSRPADDPLFVFDGADCLPPGVPNPDPTTLSTQMLSKGLVRIELPIPAGADFTLIESVDPLHCPTAPSARSLRMYRRPLPAANTAFLSTVMWDGRENIHPPNDTVPLVQADLAHQADSATLGHAQALAPLPTGDPQAIVGFETNLFNAQRKIGMLNLEAAGAHGGAEFLVEDTLPNFYIGINDVLNCAIPLSCQPGRTATFSKVIFTVFSAWEERPPNADAAAIGRGERLFNTRTIHINVVPGINGPDDTLGIPTPFDGVCGTCHDSPNIGNHSTSLPIDIGLTAAPPVGGLDVSGLPSYTFLQPSTGRTVTLTDPGRGLISGHFKDLGKTKGPTLRALAARAPYFHNGSAKDLSAVIDFYEARFHIGLSDQERADLIAFLRAL
jgi:hypothetical protein